jgi:hypothetical protein
MSAWCLCWWLVVESARSVVPWSPPEARPREAYGPFATRERCEAALATAQAAPGEADWRIEVGRCERRPASEARR